MNARSRPQPKGGGSASKPINSPEERPSTMIPDAAPKTPEIDPRNAYVRLRRGSKGNVLDRGWGRGGNWTRPEITVIRAHAAQGGNLAILTGQRSGAHFTIDVDPKNGGEETLAALEAEFGALPRSNVVRTPSGGVHLNFSTAGLGFSVSNDSNGKVLGPGVDIKGEYGYRVAPGSVTEQGTYIQEAGGVAGPYDAPPGWLADRLRLHFAGRERAAESRSMASDEAVKVEHPAECCEALARAAVASAAGALDRLARLPEGKRVRVSGRLVGWDEGAWLIAARLAEIARWPYASVSLAEAREVFDEHAPPPADGFDPGHKWAQGEAEAGGWLKGRTHRIEVHIEEDYPVTVLPREGLWCARPLLLRLHDFARARRVSPWALLGCTLARTAASVPPSVVLPPLVGGDGSLNSFIALCGASGTGKTAAQAAATEFLRPVGGIDFLTTGAGSGEGLIASYVHTEGGTKADPEVRAVRHNISTLYFVDEVQGLGALAGRTNSTLVPFLKQAWVGSTLATQNASRETNRRVEQHEYRLALVAGVQPEHAEVIFSDVGGGFPQRWLWLPTYDPGRLPRGAGAGAKVEPWTWNVPDPVAVTVSGKPLVAAGGRHRMGVPECVRVAVDTALEANNRPMGSAPAHDTIDGHAVFTREKVAALLALLDGRLDISVPDWRLAGLIMAKSDETRSLVLTAHAAEASREADRKAARQGKSASIAEGAKAEADTERVAQSILKRLSREDGWTAGAELRKALSSSVRGSFKTAVERLVERHEVTTREVAYRSARGAEYRAAR